MIWATVSSQSCFCWLYRASPSLAAKNIINLISVLTIWWCPCVESSVVLLEECVGYGQCVLLAKLYYPLPCFICMCVCVCVYIYICLYMTYDYELWFSTWKIPCIEEPSKLQSMVSQRVGHDKWLSTHASFIHSLWFPSPGIFPIQGSNLGLQHCQSNSLPSELPGKPYICSYMRQIYNKK